MFHEARILEALQAAKMEPINEAIGRQMAYAEENMVRGLEEIVRRAQTLLGQIRADHRPEMAAFLIADSAGASGPIGSTWEKTVAAATELNTLVRVGIKPVEVK